MYKKIIHFFEKSEEQPVQSSFNSNNVKINPEHGAKIATAYHDMKHDPDHPEVKQAYGALIDETKQQFNDLMGKGLKISRIEPGMENPYKNSKELHADIKNNNHLWYFPTELGHGDNQQSMSHPMLQPTGIKHGNKELLANDLFRIVHDINGHHIGGESGFGPTGEHKAYLTHKQMYSPLAAKALASETLGQNSWVNFGPHGEHNRKNPSQTIYAEQKAGLLPDEIINGNWHTEEVKKNEKFNQNLKKGSLQRKMPFNPSKDVSDDDAKKTYEWQEYYDYGTGGFANRQAVPSIAKINLNAKNRAIHKLHSRTEVKRHPETGERMFLLHRGVHPKEGQPSSTFRSSWTPHLDIANHFAEMYGGKTFSAWVPESKIHSVLPQLGNVHEKKHPGKNYLHKEHEVIVTPHDFVYAEKTPLSTNQKINTRVDQKNKTDNVKTQKLAASENITEYDLLEKAADEDQLINIKDPEQKRDILDWSKKHIPNLPMRIWYLNHVGKNPEIHKKHQKNMEHHGVMHKHNSYINDIKFNNKLSLEDGLKQLDDADRKYQGEILSKKKLVDPEKYNNITEALKLNDDWSWYNLGKSSCTMEGKAMGHCGTGKPQNTLYSLRKKVTKGNKTYHEPHLTFEVNPDGVIVQAKGKANNKPEKKYHGAIVPFLMSKHATGIMPSEWKPESDFQFSDLSPENKQKVNETKPTFDFFNSAYDKNHPVAKINAPQVESHRKLWEDFGGDFDRFTNEGLNDKDGRLAQAVAEHPNHTPETLANFADHEDEYVTRAVAGHSNTSLETLMKLADHKDSETAQVATRHWNHTPESLAKLADHENPKVAKLAAEHPNHTPESLAKLADHKNPDVVLGAVLNNNHTPETLAKLADHKNDYVAGLATRHWNHTPESLAKLAGHENSIVASGVAGHSNTSPETLAKLAGHENPVVAQAVAENPNTSSESLAKLAGHEHPIVTRAVAGHSNTSSESLAKLAGHEDPVVARAVARHRNTSPETLIKLAGHEDDYTATTAAEHPNHTPESLAKLADHEDPAVARTVAGHSNTSPETLAKLADRKNIGKEIGVARAIVHNRNTSPESLAKLADHEDPNIVLHILHFRDSNISAETLAKIADRKNIGKESDIAYAVARHPNTSSESLAKLADHTNLAVARAVVRHSNTSSESLAKLANHENEGVAATAIQHPNHTPESLAKLADHENSDAAKLAIRHSNHTSESLAKFADRKNIGKEAGVARAIAENRNTSAETLAKLAGHENSIVASGVARHRNTSPETLAKLADHKDPKVSEIAKNRIQSTINKKETHFSDVTYSEQEIIDILKHSVLKKAVEYTKKYPNISKQELKKNFGKFLRNGVALLGLSQLGPYMDSKPIPEKSISSTQNQADEKQKSSANEKQKKINDFLQTTSMVESSGGKNLDHPTIKHGPHKGDKAIGEWALMPNTIKEVAKRMKDVPEIAVYAKMKKDKMAESLAQNPHHQKTIASFLANKLYDKFGGDENKMAFSWNQGHNIQPESFKKERKNYMEHEYTKKYNQAKKQTSPSRSPADLKNNKIQKKSPVLNNKKKNM